MTVKHYFPVRTNVVLRPAWRRNDPAIERDAELFWRKQRLLPPTDDAGERLSELCLAGYDGDTLIALTSARIRYVEFLGVKLAMLRVAIATERRRNRIASFIQAESRELLEQWSAVNPAEEVMGMGTVGQLSADMRKLIADTGINPPTPAYYPGGHLSFVGWTGNGEQMRVAWFEQGRIPLRRPEAPLSPPASFNDQVPQ
jgi:hypothetical protein